MDASDPQFPLSACERPTLRETVGRRIRCRREDLGLLQAQLARRAGLSVGFLSDVENGRRGISVENLVAIADVLGRRIDWFVRPEPAPVPPEDR